MRKFSAIYPNLHTNYNQFIPNLPDKGEVIVEAVEGGRHKVEAEHLLVLEDALTQGGRRLILHVDGAAEHQLEGLGDEDDGDGVVRILPPPVSARCHKHTLCMTQVRIW